MLKWIGCTGLIFLGYNLVAGTVPPESLFAGFLVGALSGVAIGRGVGERTVPLRRCAAVGAAALGVAIFTAVPVHGIADVRPDIDHMKIDAAGRLGNGPHTLDSARTQIRSAR